MSKYFINIFLVLLPFAAFAQEADSVTEEETETQVIRADSFSQVRFGFDISRPVWNYFLEDRTGYEFALDYYYKKELYFVAEGGWGSARLDYADLRYSSNNAFIRAGINKGMLKRLSPHDWDMGFIGVRYGVAPISRSQASYTIIDSFWGNTSGTIPADNMTLHWAEVVGGIRVELVKGLFAGWSVRGKFRINKSDFQELPPSYIAGYGKGDKGSIFDFNFYIDYAIRWKRAARQPAPANLNNNIARPPADSSGTGQRPAPYNKPPETPEEEK